LVLCVLGYFKDLWVPLGASYLIEKRSQQRCRGKEGEKKGQYAVVIELQKQSEDHWSL
jgi:hypothetical protein